MKESRYYFSQKCQRVERVTEDIIKIEHPKMLRSGKRINIFIS